MQHTASMGATVPSRWQRGLRYRLFGFSILITVSIMELRLWRILSSRYDVPQLLVIDKDTFIAIKSSGRTSDRTEDESMKGVVPVLSQTSDSIGFVPASSPSSISRTDPIDRTDERAAETAPIETIKHESIAGVNITVPASSQSDDKKKNQYLRYQKDVLCPYCRYSYTNPLKTVTCNRKILAGTKGKKNATILESATSLARSGICTRCDPAACTDAEKAYYRLDAVAPPVKQAVTHHLQSISAQHRIPPTALDDLTTYLSAKEHVYPERQYFFEFNPSIVKLPESQRISDEAVYLASFRVSTRHNCVADADDTLKLIGGTFPRPEEIGYLGLAVLDHNLEIVQEIVVDARTAMRRFQDARLFVLHDQIYVGSYARLHPLWLQSPPAIINPQQKETIVLEHVWPEETTATANSRTMLPITMGMLGTCSKDRTTVLSGKNLNYFVDANNETVQESYPLALYEMLDLKAPCDKSTPRKDAVVQLIRSNESLPYPSFGTTDELNAAQRNTELAYSGDRGSACCVPIQHQDDRSLLLGISHSKTWLKQKQEANQYVSSFYAFEPIPPYRVVARSGRFCFGFSAEKDQNPYARMQMNTLHLVHNEYDCPSIHFVSGMVEKADDPTKLIVAYGINDCVPRMVVIDKAQVLRMLFAPHEMMMDEVL